MFRYLRQALPPPPPSPWPSPAPNDKKHLLGAPRPPVVVIGNGNYSGMRMSIGLA